MTTEPAGKPGPNWALLAGLRFVLAAQVMLGHIAQLFSGISIFTYICNLHALGSLIGFWIISGYSIAASIDRDPHVGRFFERRFWRLWPVHVTCIAIGCAPFVIKGLLAINGPSGECFMAPTVYQTLCSLFLTQGVASLPISTYGPSWTLGTEVCLYLTAPLIRRLPSKWIAGILAVSALCFAMGTHLLPAGYYNSPGLFMVFSVSWAWLIGWLLYRHPAAEWAPLLTVAVPLALMVGNPFGTTPCEGLWGLGVFMVIAYRDRILMSARQSAWAQWLGGISLPLYLVHSPLIFCTFVFTGLHNPWAYALLATVGAIVLHYGVEGPVKMLRRHRATAPSALPNYTLAIQNAGD